VPDNNGNLYGTTILGGVYGRGTVFKINTNATLTSLYSFTGGSDGANPRAELVQGSDGLFYGTTTNGGVVGLGTIYRITAEGNLTSLYSFTGSNGANPYAALVQGNDNEFYGTTFSGGSYGRGTVFKFSAQGDFTSLYSFTGAEDGMYPIAALTQGRDGLFYGTTAYGGTNFVGPMVYYCCGTIFRITSGGMLTHLHSFSLSDEGNFPQAALREGDNGAFYGTIPYGGPAWGGTVFKITTNGSLETLYAFTEGDTNGYWPVGALTRSRDGSFYGVTQAGGSAYGGVLFKLSNTGSVSNCYSFPSGGGTFRQGPLVPGSDSSLYGTTYSGGPGVGGTIFRLSPGLAGPQFQSVTLTQGRLLLTWSAEIGRSYQLQGKFDLTSSPWVNLQSPLTALRSTLSISYPITNGAPQFFRVALLP
jgi:uncharacterized repeat protein (TIGR03803 family)